MTPQPITDANRIWAERLQRWGLAGLAPILFPMLRPFGFIGSQFLNMAAPILTTYVDPVKLADLSDLLEDPDRLQQLMQTLEDEADR
jgi:hypothetical protein